MSLQDFHFVAPVSKASPLLLKACATGEHIKKAVLTVRKAGKEQIDYLKVTMEDCLISSFQESAEPPAEGDPIPQDQVSFNFAKIEHSYTPQNADGSLGDPVVVVVEANRTR